MDHTDYTEDWSVVSVVCWLRAGPLDICGSPLATDHWPNGSAVVDLTSLSTRLV